MKTTPFHETHPVTLTDEELEVELARARQP